MALAVGCRYMARNPVDDPLAYHHHRGMRTTRPGNARHHRRINHPQPLDALDSAVLSTTAMGSESGPILQVPDTCLAVPTVWRIQRSKASSSARMASVGWIRRSTTSLYASDSSSLS